MGRNTKVKSNPIPTNRFIDAKKVRITTNKRGHVTGIDIVRPGRGPAKQNAGKTSFRKTKKALRKIGEGIKSSKRRKYVVAKHGGHPERVILGLKQRKRRRHSQHERLTNPTRFGTSYFITKSAAIRYYRPYGYDDPKAAVERKLREGEIHIGRPPLKAGQRAQIISGEGRYEIVENPRKR